MKKVTTLGLLILIIAIAGFFFSSYAAQIKKTTIKPLTIKTTKPSQTKEKAKKPYSKDTSKKSLKQILKQPDLVVEALRLKGGFIAFTLKNRGPGSLSDDDHKQGRVVISYKGFKKRYYFSKIDPTGKLKESGGGVPYTTRAMLTSRQDVTVVVAYGKNKKSMLTRTLGKTQPSRIAKPGKKTGLKDISEAPTKQKKALKTPSKKDKALARPMAEPLISIAKVFQKDGNVRIVVQNKGRGRLSTRDYMQGKVRLNIGGKTRSWSLKKIDPTGRLGRYGGEVEFDTGLTMKPNQRVMAGLEKVKGDKAKRTMLSPTVTKAKIKQKERKGKPKGGGIELPESGQLVDGGSAIERVSQPPTTSMMAAEGPTRPGQKFPARITSVTCPIKVRGILFINGYDFGRNEGRVDIALPDQVFSCEVTDWSDDRVRCVVPTSMGEAVGGSAKEAVIWVKPARIEPPDPKALRFPGDSGETPYYYNGEEGPHHICTITPMTADMAVDQLNLSSSEVTLGDSLDVSFQVINLSSGGKVVEPSYKIVVLGTSREDWNRESLFLHTGTCQNLAPGVSRTVSNTVTLPTNIAVPDECSIGVWVNHYPSTFPEINFDNNKITVPITLLAGRRPDLSIYSINMNPISTYVFNLNIGIKNIGSREALPTKYRIIARAYVREVSYSHTGYHQTSYYWHTLYRRVHDLNSVSPGQIIYPPPIEIETHLIRSQFQTIRQEMGLRFSIEVDREGTLFEADESNNTEILEVGDIGDTYDWFW